MLGWASQQFEKLSQTVAPPPADANGRFLFAVQKGDEDVAMACVTEMDPARAVINPTKRTYAIHLACLHCMDRLIRLLLTQPGVDLTFIDTHGNTPLHYAAMSTDKVRALPTIKMLVQEFNASVIAKNSVGQTPYDLASLDGVRQFLLPLQLQEETRIAIDNGGVGLPPGIDMGGLRISNPAAPPPPIMPMAPAPMSSPAPHVYQTPAHDTPKPPASGEAGGYARVGGSSAAIYKPAGRTFVKADGFHSSSSDVNLQRKYGHLQVNYSNVPPPPTSGNAPGATAFAPPSGGANPFAGGTNPYASMRASQRYVSYDAVTGQTSSAPRTGPSAYGSYTAAAAAAVPNVNVFSPGGAPAPTSGHNMTGNSPASMQEPNGGYPYSQPAPATQETAGHNLAASSPAATQAPNGGYPYSQPAPALEQQANGLPQQQYPSSGTPYAIKNPAVAGMSPPPFSSASAATVTSPMSGGLSPMKTDPGVAASLFSSPPSGGVGFSAPTSGGVVFSPAPNEAAANLFGSQPGQGASTESAGNVFGSPAPGLSVLTPPSNGGPTQNHMPSAQPGADAASSMFASQPGEGSASHVFGSPAADQTANPQPVGETPTNNCVSSSQPRADAGSYLFANQPSSETPPFQPIQPESSAATSALQPNDASVASNVFGTPAVDQSVPGQTTSDRQASDPLQTHFATNTSSIFASQPSSDVAGSLFDSPAADQTVSAEPTGDASVNQDSSAAQPETESAEAAATTSSEDAKIPADEDSGAEAGAQSDNWSTALPDGWSEHIDHGSGRPYYYNEYDNTTSWDRPTPLPDTPTSAPLPSGWRELMDPSSGMPYYFNEIDNTTSWDRPIVPSGQSSAKTAEAEGATKGNEDLSQRGTNADGQPEPSQPAGSTFVSASSEQPGGGASQFFGSPPSTQSGPEQATRSGFDGVIDNASNGVGAASALFGSPINSVPVSSPSESLTNPSASSDNGKTELSGKAFGTPAATSPTPSPAIAPTSGGFSLAGEALNSAAAADLFATSTKSEESPTKQPEQSGSKPDESLAPESTDRAVSPAGSEEGLDDVPLSPDAPPHPPVALAQPMDASSAFDAPPPNEFTGVSTTVPATPGAESLFAAIGMPPPPFSATKR